MRRRTIYSILEEHGWGCFSTAKVTKLSTRQDYLAYHVESNPRGMRGQDELKEAIKARFPKAEFQVCHYRYAPEIKHLCIMLPC